MPALLLLLLVGTLGALAAPPSRQTLLPGDLRAIKAIAAEQRDWVHGPETDPCAWTGVVVCENFRVTKITSHEWFGPFPAALFNLTALTYLDLSGSFFCCVPPELAGNLTTLSFTIPPQLGNLSALTYLDLSSTSLTGTIPPELGKLTALTYLDLSSNDLSGTIPPELGKLTTLTYLDLSFGSLTGNIPPELGKLTALTYMNLSMNSLSGTISPQLGKLTALTSLDLHLTGFSGTIPLELWNLTALTYLDLSYNRRLSGTIPPELGKLTTLTYLDLRSNSLFSTIPPELWNLTALTTLDLSYNCFSGTIPPELGRLIALTYLSLSSTNLNGTIPTELGKLTALTYLDPTLSGTIPPELWSLTALTKLSLSCLNPTSSTIPPGLWNLTALTSLSLTGCNFSGDIPRELGKLTALTDLDLSNNKFSGIPPGLELELGKLTSLTLRGNSLTGTIPPELGNLKALTSPFDPFTIGFSILDLSSNGLSGAIPPELGRLIGLGALNLSSNGLSGAIPPELGNMTGLGVLDLKNNNLSGPIPRELGNLTTLVVLDLSSNSLSGPITTIPWHIDYFFSIDLSSNFLNGTGEEKGWSLGLNCFNTSREKVYTAGQRDPALCSVYYPELNCTCPPPKVAGAKDSCSCVLPLLFLANFVPDPEFQPDYGTYTPLSAFSASLLETRSAIGSFFAGHVEGLSQDLIAPVNFSSGAPSVVSLYFYVLPPPGAPRFTAYLEANTLDAAKLLLKSKPINVTGFIPGPGYVMNIPLPSPPPTSPSPSTPVQTPAAPLLSSPASKSSGGSSVIIVTASVAAFVAACAALLAFAVWLRCRRPRPKCITIEDTQVKQWKLAHVRAATQNFNSKYEIGKGGFATVYRGDFKGGVMAVKRLVKASTQLQEELVKEVQTVGSIHNRNLLALRGYCMEDDEFILIYDFMANGSLKARLFDPAFASSPLDWGQCIDIIVGTASGIAYLHEGCKETIIHRDIKPANILLDDNMLPQVADFGLVRSTPLNETHVSTKVAGTLGFLAPEYVRSGHLTTKSDVYSFGILMMVTISHMPANTPSPDGCSVFILDRARSLAVIGSLHALVAPNLSVSSIGAEAERLLYIALMCTQEEWEARPTMGQVVQMLTSDVPVPKLSFLERLSSIAYPMEGMENSSGLSSNQKLEYVLVKGGLKTQ